ncbi:unnamed protein product, partial [Rangifer tarandus platyrhynchus]
AEGAGHTARVPTRWWRQVRGPGRAHPASVRLQLHTVLRFYAPAAGPEHPSRPPPLAVPRRLGVPLPDENVLELLPNRRHGFSRSARKRSFDKICRCPRG